MNIAFHLPGGIPVYTFSLLIALGAVLGLSWALLLASAEHRQAVFQLGLWALLGAGIAGRAAYVAIHWPYFQLHPTEIAQVWLGGNFGAGALIGGICAYLIAAALMRENLGARAGDLLPLLTAVAASAWLGCWVNGCAYGPVTDAWWGIPVRDVWGDVASRWPLQPVSALLTLLLFWEIDQGRARGRIRAPGLAASLEGVGLSLLGTLVASLRVDPVPLWRGFGLDGWCSLGVLVFSFVITIVTVSGYGYPTNDQNGESHD
jgi:prolipoprotein diacylglyceryltransferase